MNTLICDDAGFIRAIAKEALQQFENLIIFEARDGYQATEILMAMKFELILLDMVLPHKNGLQVAAFARSQNPEVYIIGMTSLEIKDNPEYSHSDQLINQWLIKPFTKNQLLTAVENQLSKGIQQK